MDIWGSTWAQLGAVGLLAVLILLIFTGRLYPRSLVDKILREADQQVERADKRAELSRLAAEAADQRADTATSAVAQMLPVLQTVEKLVSALGDGKGAV
jgi:hypothetical protein